jgi:hypothetical protein
MCCLTVWSWLHHTEHLLCRLDCIIRNIYCVVLTASYGTFTVWSWPHHTEHLLCGLDRTIQNIYCVVLTASYGTFTVWSWPHHMEHLLCGLDHIIWNIYCVVLTASYGTFTYYWCNIKSILQAPVYFTMNLSPPYQVPLVVTCVGTENSFWLMSKLQYCKSVQTCPW